MSINFDNKNEEDCNKETGIGKKQGNKNKILDLAAAKKGGIAEVQKQRQCTHRPYSESGVSGKQYRRADLRPNRLDGTKMSCTNDKRSAVSSYDCNIKGGRNASNFLEKKSKDSLNNKIIHFVKNLEEINYFFGAIHELLPHKTRRLVYSGS